MTSFVHGSRTDIVFGGKILSGYFNSASFSRTRDTAETTTFKKTTKTYIPGLQDNTLSLEGFVTKDLDDAEERLHDLISVPEGLVSYFPAGIENGAAGYSLWAVENSYEVNSEIGDAVKVSAEFQGSRAFQLGYVVANGSAASPSTGIAGPIGAANAEATAAIQVANVATALLYSFQDSADGTTWADVAGTSVSANLIGGYTMTAPSVRRHVRVKWTGNGTHTILLTRAN